MVRVAGENSILAGGTGAECRRNRGAAGVDASVGACLLFGDLPVGGISGCDFVDQRETEKEKIPFFVFAGRIVAEVRCAGVVRRRSGRRYRFAGGVARSVQFLRPHRAKPVRSRVSVGKQPAGLSGRKGRQLRFLPDGGVDEKSADFSRGRRYFRDADRAGMA